MIIRTKLLDMLVPVHRAGLVKTVLKTKMSVPLSHVGMDPPAL